MNKLIQPGKNHRSISIITIITAIVTMLLKDKEKKVTKNTDLTYIGDAFIGTNLLVETIQGEFVKRVYFDSAASTLALKPSQTIMQNFLNYYSNSHSSVHLTAKISTQLVEWAQDRIKRFVGADEHYSTIFIGSGTTAVMNRLAAGLSKLRPNRKTVLLSIMEHHSNDLPHRLSGNQVIHLNVIDEEGAFVGIDLKKLENILIEQNGNVNYISITGASNVTGNIIPIHDIAEIAHKYDAYIIVDGAQLISHSPVQLVNDNPSRSIDFFIFSGHKMYSPGTPGVLVGKSDLLQKMTPEYYGGGMVNAVSTYDFELATSVSDKEHAGTLNIPGILTIAATIEFMSKIGMENVYEKEIKLTNYLIKEIAEIPGISIYPKKNDGNKIGIVSFNLIGVPHQLLATVLNDYFGIAVRNDCFCAHPFVRECLKEELWNIEDEDQIDLFKGMVRVSLGIYSTKADVDLLITALKKITSNSEFYFSHYKKNDQKQFKHLTFERKLTEYFDIDQEMERCFTPYFIKPQNDIL